MEWEAYLGTRRPRSYRRSTLYYVLNCVFICGILLMTSFCAVLTVLFGPFLYMYRIPMRRRRLGYKLFAWTWKMDIWITNIAIQRETKMSINISHWDLTTETCIYSGVYFFIWKCLCGIVFTCIPIGLIVVDEGCFNSTNFGAGNAFQIVSGSSRANFTIRIAVLLYFIFCVWLCDRLIDILVKATYRSYTHVFSHSENFRLGITLVQFPVTMFPSSTPNNQMTATPTQPRIVSTTFPRQSNMPCTPSFTDSCALDDTSCKPSKEPITIVIDAKRPAKSLSPPPSNMMHSSTYSPSAPAAPQEFLNEINSNSYFQTPSVPLKESSSIENCQSLQTNLEIDDSWGPFLTSKEYDGNTLPARSVLELNDVTDAILPQEVERTITITSNSSQQSAFGDEECKEYAFVVQSQDEVWRSEEENDYLPPFTVRRTLSPIIVSRVLATSRSNSVEYQQMSPPREESIDYDTFSPSASVVDSFVRTTPSTANIVQPVFRGLPQMRTGLAEEPKIFDNVHFSAYAPALISPTNESFNFNVWAYLAEQREEMHEIATADSKSCLLSRESIMRIRNGACFHITLDVPDGFLLDGEASRAAIWNGIISNINFSLICTDEAKYGQIMFKCAIVVGKNVAYMRSYIFVSPSAQRIKNSENASCLLETELEVLDESYEEIPYSSLDIIELVGQGYYGDAYRAKYNGEDVSAFYFWGKMIFQRQICFIIIFVSGCG